MSDATEVRDDVADDEGTTNGARPTSFLPPPTFPEAMLGGGGGDDDGDGHPGDAPAPGPMLTAAPDEGPDKPGLLIRLGHLLSGRPNGAR